MSSIPKLMTDLDCGWDDEVGGSITNYALGLAGAQEKAAAALQAMLGEAERAMAATVDYQSRAGEIQSCRID